MTFLRLVVLSLFAFPAFAGVLPSLTKTPGKVGT